MNAYGLPLMRAMMIVAIVASCAVMPVNAFGVASVATEGSSESAGQVTASERSREEVETVAALAAASDIRELTGVVIAKGTLRGGINALAAGSAEGNPATPAQTELLERPVYVVAMEGEFVLEDAKVPRGDKAPAGSHLTLMIDAATGSVEGRSLTSRPPVLSSMGPVGVE